MESFVSYELKIFKRTLRAIFLFSLYLKYLIYADILDCSAYMFEL